MPIESDNTTSDAEDFALLQSETTEVAVPEVQDAEFVDETTEVEPYEDDPTPEVTDDLPVPSSAEVLSPNDRVAFAQVKKLYPDFFKKFPGLGRVIQREREYAVLFPTIDIAKEAKENSEAMEILQGDISSGDLSKFLSSVKELGDSSLMNLSKRFLAALSKVSLDAHWQAALPLLQNTVRAFYKQGTAMGNTEQGQNYQNSALYLSQYLFGNFEVATGQANAVQPLIDAAPSTIEQERQAFKSEKYRDYYATVANDCTEKLNQMILEKDNAGNYKIDPSGTMTQWLRDTIASKIFTEVAKQMEADYSHVSYMNTLWNSCRKTESYNSETKAKIVNAFLARARPLVSSIRPRLSSEATGTRVRAERNETTTTRRDPRPQGRPSNGTSRTPLAREIDWSATSDLDLLNGTETLKARK